MLVGYNDNITFNGKVYHVQTEDSGMKNPVIITLLYYKGTILGSKKTEYSHILSSPDMKIRVRDLMKTQHHSMLKELHSGRYTHEAPEEDISSPIETDSVTLDITEKDEDKKDKSLDDILLDYILKKEKGK